MTQEIILVTGGAGFIGSHTVGQLLEAGHHVVVLDNFRTGKRENLDHYKAHADRLHIYEVDIVEGLWPTCQQITQDVGPIDRIIHLAAQISVVASIANPVEDVRINYTTIVQLLEYARLHGVKKVVMASSAAVYGDVDVPLVSESIRPRPLSPYGIHKHSSELQFTYYQEVHGVSATALRFFNVYGPRLEASGGYASVIPIFFRCALAGEPLRIFGDGEQTRDFVFVEDIARALCTACFSDQGGGEAINIGTGAPTTINELAQTIIDLVAEDATTGTQSHIEHLPHRPGEILHSCCDTSLAEQRFGPQTRTTLRDGLAKTLAWHTSRS